jgi:hypothetical protein
LRLMTAADVFIVWVDQVKPKLIRLFASGQRLIFKLKEKRKDCYA